MRLVKASAIVLACNLALGLISVSAGAATVTVKNQQSGSITVFLGFTNLGCYTMPDFPCTVTKGNPNICSFPLAAGATQSLPFGKTCQTSFAIAINNPPWGDCPLTQAEFTLQGAGSMDTYDVSLVNGFSVGMSIVPSTGTTAGPATSATGNQNNTGVFPLLCDGCAVSISPPQPPAFPNCPKPDSSQCHGGTQFDPKPPCQLTQATGTNYTVNVLSETSSLCDAVGENRLAAGNIDEARELFTRRLKEAIVKNDTTRQLACFRSLGFSAQRKAALLRDKENRKPLLQEAAQSYEEVLKIKHDSADALQALVNIYIEIGKTDRATELRKKLIEIQGGNSGSGGGGGGFRSRYGSCNMYTGECCYGYPEFPCGSTGGGGFESVENNVNGERLATNSCKRTSIEPPQLVHGRLLARNVYVLTSSEGTSNCPKVDLDPPPTWAASGSWDNNGNLIIADTAGNRLLIYNPDQRSSGSSISELDSECCRQFSFLSGLIVTDYGWVVQDRGTSLSLVNTSRRPVWHLDLAAGTNGAKMEINSLSNWALAEDFLLGFGDITRTSGASESAIFYAPLFAPNYSESILSIEHANPARDYYLSGFPYFADAGNSIYFISMTEEAPVIYEFKKPTGKTISNPKKIYVLPKELKGGLPPSYNVAQFLEGIGNSTMPAGLYFKDNRLFLLTRKPSSDSTTIWELSVIDPQKSAQDPEGYKPSRKWPLPVQSAYLTVVPGKKFWALLAKEKPIISSQGLRQKVASVVLMPSEMLNFDLPLCGGIAVAEDNNRSQPGERAVTLHKHVTPLTVHE